MPFPDSTPGTLFPIGVYQGRVTVYQALPTGDGDLQVVEWSGGNSLDVSSDFKGGSIQYENTPTGCGAATLNTGLFWEQMTLGPADTPYWLARNIVEVSCWDDVVQADISEGATKIYVYSRYGYDLAVGHDAGQIILDDGTNVTYRIPVTGCGTDGGGDYITVGDPLAYPGSPTHSPAYAAGTKIFRRRYTGIIMRRGLTNDLEPKGQITCTGLAQYLSECVGSFTINLDEVGDALYQSVYQFSSVGRFPQLIVDEANFPYTGNAYSGSNQQYTLADELTQILSGGITNGDTWVIHVGHDRVIRLLRLFSQSCDAYEWTLLVHQNETYFEAMVVTAEDEDVSNFYNSIEVTGDTDITTKQPFGAIVQDDESITLFGQVDGVPVSNTSCKSDDDCALYAQSLLNDNAIPRNNYKLKMFTYNSMTSIPGGFYAPLGLTRGDQMLGVHNIKIDQFNGGAANINGLCISVVTTIAIGVDAYQEASFAQVEPNWNLAVKERANRFAITLRRNVLTAVSVDSYMVGPFADQYTYSPGSLVVKNKAFQAAFAYGSGIQTVAAIDLTMQPSTTNWVWLNNDGSFTQTYQGQPGNTQPDHPPNPNCMLHSIFQTSASGVMGDIFKAPRGVLNNGGTGGPGGGVASLNDESGVVVLESTGGSVQVTEPDSQHINLEAALSTLSDVEITSLTDGDVLEWNATDSKWENVAGGGGGSGTVTSVGSGTGILTSPNPITGAGTVALAPAADKTIKSNISGGSAVPIDNTLSAILDDILGSTQGSLLYRAGSLWVVLGPGTAGQVLSTGGPGANPSWINVSSGSGFGFSAAALFSAMLALSPTILYKFNDASGSTILDSSGNGNNGTYQSPSTSQFGVYGAFYDKKCVYFDGANSYATLPIGLSTSAWTLVLVVRLFATNNNFPCIIADGHTTSSDDGITMGSNNGTPPTSMGLAIRNGGGLTQTGLGTSADFEGRSVMFAASYDGTTMSFYVDGVVASAAKTGAYVNGPHPVQIGSNPSYGSSNWGGWYDAFMLINGSTLTQAQILSLYLSMGPR